MNYLFMICYHIHVLSMFILNIMPHVYIHGPWHSPIGCHVTRGVPMGTTLKCKSISFLLNIECKNISIQVMMIYALMMWMLDNPIMGCSDNPQD